MFMSARIHIKIKTFFSRILSPTRIFVLSFAAVIITGGILLWFPFSATKDHLRFVDALFSSRGPWNPFSFHSVFKRFFSWVGSLSRRLQCHFCVQQLWIFALFRQSHRVPGGPDCQSDHYGVDCSWGDWVYRPV